jgi:hypothetical protein
MTGNKRVDDRFKGERRMHASVPPIRALLKVQVQLARDAARAKVESLLAVHRRSGLAFDDSSFKVALDDVRVLLDDCGRSAIRGVILDLRSSGYAITENTRQVLADGIDRGLKHIFDNAFEKLRAEQARSVAAGKAAKIKMWPTRPAKAG